MIKEQGNIENILEYINGDEKLRKRHQIPDEFNHLIARHLFYNPAVNTISPDEIVAHPFKQQQLK